MSNPIFIIGCPRSGTTILGEFFENDNKFNYYREIDIWEKQLHPLLKKIFFYGISFILPFTRRSAKFSIFSKIIRQGIIDSLSAIKILPGYDNKIQGHRMNEKDVTPERYRIARSYLNEDKVLVVKATLNSVRIPFIKKIFPDAKFIHIIRDGRDVSCSLMNAPSGFFWSYIKPPGWKKIKKKYKGILRCVWQWKTTLDIINEDKKKIPNENFIEIFYEDLVTNPEKTIRVLFEKLDISFEKKHEELCNKVNNKVEKKFLAREDKTTIFDHPYRIGRFKDELSEDELSGIEETLGISNWLPISQN